METYLTTAQVAEALQISIPTARTIIKANMSYLLVGKEIRVKESEVTNYLNKAERKID